MSDEDIQLEPLIEKPSKADRILRDEAARRRRAEVKQSKSIHSFKEEKENRERLKSKRRMEKLQKRKKNG